MNYSKFIWVICWRCEGHGKVDHPAFSNGITSSEWAEWEPEERQNYFNGAYDVPCDTCKGSGKVKAPDIQSMTFEEKRELVLQLREQREEAEYQRMWAYERSMGA